MAYIYNFDIPYITEKLTPPALRSPLLLAFLRVIGWPLNIKWDDYKLFMEGDGSTVWSNATSYVLGDRVRYGIEIYEAIQANTNVIPYANTDYWLLINKDFVGSRPRALFSSQKITFEYALNLYLNTTYATIPTIYTTRNTVDVNGFYVGVDGLSDLGEMGINSNQDDYLGTSYTLGQYAMTIYVPLAIYTALASTAADREARVRNIADRYVPAGIEYSITTY